ncbi:MAG: glycosyltransferase family 4 protein [Candidatus Woesearchaeota archaeon]|nr:MAG: glycosyltransferase family 4 protein [Candidatus Woesearchaeota archaeon]
MKINVLTPVNLGGPHLGGKKLVEILNKKGIQASHTYKTKELLSTVLFPRGDIVHSMDLPLAYRLWKKPLVFTLKGDYTIQKNRWQRFYPRAIKNADVLTTTCNYLKNKLNLKDPIIIPNAVDSERFKPAKHEEKSVINIVTLTKFTFKDKSYGVLDVINNLDNVHTKNKINYTIIGYGPYIEEIKAKANPKNISVNFTGAVPEPADYLSKADIFLYYSTHDVFPHAVLEAMASSLPVVTNNIGAIPEMIENNKEGFIRDTPEEYQKAISDLVDDYKLRKRLGEAARSKVIRNFSWERVASDYINVYKKVL